MSAVIINDQNELLALHRALVEAKFHGRPNDPAIPGSPFLADISNRVADALQDYEEKKVPGGGAKWVEWRRMSQSRREWRIAIDYVASTRDWNRLSEEAKTDFARVVLSPFVLNAKTLEEFILKADAAVVKNEDSKS